MTQFDESKHKRHADGKFANKPHAEADGVSLAPPEPQEATIQRRISYEVYGYPTTRSRKLRKGYVTETVDIPLPNIPAADAPLAVGNIRVHGDTYYKPIKDHGPTDYGYREDGTSWHDLEDCQYEWNTPAVTSDYERDRTREAKKREAAEGLVMIDGQLHQETGEPCITITRHIDRDHISLGEAHQRRPDWNVYRLDDLETAIADNPDAVVSRDKIEAQAKTIHDPALLGRMAKPIPNIETNLTRTRDARHESPTAHYQRVMGQVRDAGLIHGNRIDWQSMSEHQESYVKDAMHKLIDEGHFIPLRD